MLLDNPDFQAVCLRRPEAPAEEGCRIPDSIVNFMFPSRVDGNGVVADPAVVMSGADDGNGYLKFDGLVRMG